MTTKRKSGKSGKSGRSGKTGKRKAVKVAQAKYNSGKHAPKDRKCKATEDVLGTYTSPSDHCIQVKWNGAMFYRLGSKMVGEILDSGLTVSDSSKPNEPVRVYDAVRNAGGVSTFFSYSGIGYSEVCSGPMPAGSVDLLSVPASGLWVSCSSTEVQGKLGLEVGSGVQSRDPSHAGTCFVRTEYHSSERFFSSHLDRKNSPLFCDTEGVRVIREAQRMTIVDPVKESPVLFSGDSCALVSRMVDMQTSLWTLFHAEFFHAITHMSTRSLFVYAKCTGYTSLVVVDGGRKSSAIVDLERAVEDSLASASLGAVVRWIDPASKEVRKIIRVWAKCIDSVTRALPSVTRPGFMAHFYFLSLSTIGAALSKIEHVLQTTTLFSSLQSMIDTVKALRSSGSVRLDTEQKVASIEALRHFEATKESWEYFRMCILAVHNHYVRAMRATCSLYFMLVENKIPGATLPEEQDPPLSPRSVHNFYLKQLTAAVDGGYKTRVLLAAINPFFDHFKVYDGYARATGTPRCMFLPPGQCSREVALSHLTGMNTGPEGSKSAAECFPLSATESKGLGQVLKSEIRGIKTFSQASSILRDSVRAFRARGRANWFTVFGSREPVEVDAVLAKEDEEELYFDRSDFNVHHDPSIIGLREPGMFSLRVYMFEKSNGACSSHEDVTAEYDWVCKVEDTSHMSTVMQMPNKARWLKRMDWLGGKFPFKNVVTEEAERKKKQVAKRLEAARMIQAFYSTRSWQRRNTRNAAATVLQKIWRAYHQRGLYILLREKIVYNLQTAFRNSVIRKRLMSGLWAAKGLMKSLENQMAYYFSPENLKRDAPLLGNMVSSGGVLTVNTLITFPRMQEILVRVNPVEVKASLVAAAARGVDGVQLSMPMTGPVNDFTLGICPKEFVSATTNMPDIQLLTRALDGVASYSNGPRIRELNPNARVFVPAPDRVPGHVTAVSALASIQAHEAYLAAQHAELQRQKATLHAHFPEHIQQQAWNM